MDIETVAEDKFGAASYENLFREIMSDIGKAFQMEKALLVLRPEIPLFIFSIRLRTEPASRTVADVSNIRTEGGTIHITITDERYAPDILRELWARFGRDSVRQQTRFDMEVDGAPENEVGSIVVASGEEYMKEIVGSIWRSMPEGIRNRQTYIDGPVITVVATEEVFEPHMLEEGMGFHRKMTEGGKDV
ncbi:MAG: methanogenesis marker 17 protein [Methanomassiliicoccaceae archaeon]|nr:methanogenesis marker 17 protein [Methanomassiliicoccaceae archaeon]MCL2145922.1 methanogenesis marker 17 protein [Methanomassiliicoccaceae archaeon]